MAGGKRKHTEDATHELYTNKSRARPSAVARVDPTYGQRSAIPLDEEGSNEDGELGYDEEMDALSYLRSVRREAEGIPNLIVAPRQSPPIESWDIYQNGVGDFRGRYEDGAFYAGPDEDEVEELQESEDFQTQYFNSILARFELLRQQLNQSPPLEALQKLDDDHPIYLGKFTAAKVRWWRWKMRTTNPLPAQVAAMDKDTVLGLLRLMSGGALLRRGIEVDLGVSRWAWSLLARLPERGALSSEEIGIVRELGKKAVLVGVGLKEGSKWEEGMQEVEANYDDQESEDGYPDVEVENESYVGDGLVEDEGADGDVDDEPSLGASGEEIGSSIHDFNAKEEANVAELDGLAAAKAHILGFLDSSTPEVILGAETEANLLPVLEIEKENLDDKANEAELEKAAIPVDYDLRKWNSNATVDMILTIAGEVYGQRDLLEFRGTREETV